MSTSSINDIRDGNTLLAGPAAISAGSTELRIATTFFSLDTLLLLADSLGNFDRIRILFGDDANPEQCRRLLKLLRQRSDADLLAQRQETRLPQ